MRGAVVLTYPYGLGVPGGSALDCAETARHLQEAGARVIVVPVGSLPGRGFRLHSAELPQSLVTEPQHLDLSGIGVEVLPVIPNALHSDLDGLAVRRAIQRLLKRERISAVLGFWHEAAFLPSLLEAHGPIFGMIAAAPYSVWFAPRPRVTDLFREQTRARSRSAFLASLVWRAAFRNPLMRAPGAIRRRLLFSRPLQRARVIFARSRSVSGDLRRLFGIAEEEIQVTWCGVDPMFLEIRRDRVRAATRLLFIGTLTTEKGVFDALEAVSMAIAAGERDLRLRLAGGGDSDPVNARARELGIADKIEILGHLDRPSLLEELRDAHLVLAPSHFETFGLAVAEAQLAGLPVVAYRVGALPEVVEHGSTGWLVSFGDKPGLASALLEARRTPDLAATRGERARHRAAQLFSWRHSAQAMLVTLGQLSSE